MLYRPCLLGVCYAGFLLCKPSAYLVGALKALPTGMGATMQLFWKGDRAKGCHLTAVNTLSAFS